MSTDPSLHPSAPAPTPDRTRTPARSRRSRENTRARLVEAAAVVVSRKGIEGARIDDLVREAGFTRGAFYSNYSSMEEVLREAISVRAAALVEQVRETVDAIEGHPSVDTIMEVLEAIRPEGRTMYLLSTEYTLYRMRHPEAEEIPYVGRQQISGLVAGILDEALTRMGRRPTVPSITLADVLIVFFLDSIASEATPPATATSRDPRALLRLLVEAVVLGLSLPADGEAPAAAPGAPDGSGDGPAAPTPGQPSAPETGVHIPDDALRAAIALARS